VKADGGSFGGMGVFGLAVSLVGLRRIRKRTS
jgi:hypothetical protein